MSNLSHRRESGRDKVAIGVALCAAVLSIVAYVVTASHGKVLAYNDAISHLEIARRTLISTSPGVAQLGGVWLPLPHILIMAFAWQSKLYYSGFAGSIVSMAVFVATVVLVYKIAYRLTDNKFAGVVGAAVLALNVNLLYMQATPMTESLLFCLLAAMVYYVQQWADTRRYKYLVAAGVASLLGTLTRYESWPILACLLVAVFVIAWSQRVPERKFKLHLQRTQDRVIAFSVAAFAGIGAWLVWNWAIFGSPLNFQDGEYAKPSLWLTNHEPAIGNWWVASKTYWYAMTDNVPWPLLIAACLGLACLLVQGLKRREGVNRARILPSLTLLVMVPFFVMALYAGQRPLHVMQTTGDLYNVRFGLIMILPAAIFAGCLVGTFSKLARPLTYVVGIVVMVTAALIGTADLSSGEIATLQDPVRASHQTIDVDQNAAIAYLNTYYDRGRVLMETFGNERVAFYGVPSSDLIYEGSYQQWQPALRIPSGSNIRWVIERCSGGSGSDKVCASVQPQELKSYALVYRTSDGTYSIYRKK